MTIGFDVQTSVKCCCMQVNTGFTVLAILLGFQVTLCAFNLFEDILNGKFGFAWVVSSVIPVVTLRLIYQHHTSEDSVRNRQKLVTAMQVNLGFVTFSLCVFILYFVFNPIQDFTETYIAMAEDNMNNHTRTKTDPEFKEKALRVSIAYTLFVTLLTNFCFSVVWLQKCRQYLAELRDYSQIQTYQVNATEVV